MVAGRIVVVAVVGMIVVLSIGLAISARNYRQSASRMPGGPAPADPLEDALRENVRLQAEIDRLRALGEAERRELESLRARIARDVAAGTPVTAASPEEGRPEKFAKLLEEEDDLAVVRGIAEAFERGERTPLDVMNLAVTRGELIVAGLNDPDLSLTFRSILVDSLASVADPIALLSEIEVEREPSQRISARLGDLVIDEVDDAEEVDPRVVPVVERLLAGNDMFGQKVNLYPTLAQLGHRGDPAAREHIERYLEEPRFIRAGLEALLDPPSHDEQGQALRAVVIYHIQFNKGKWTRPRQFQMGDVVLAIGDVPVHGRADFVRAIRQHRSRETEEFVEARVFARSEGAERYEPVTRLLDPGDFRLMYSVSSIRSLP